MDRLFAQPLAVHFAVPGEVLETLDLSNLGPAGFAAEVGAVGGGCGGGGGGVAATEPHVKRRRAAVEKMTHASRPVASLFLAPMMMRVHTHAVRFVVVVVVVVVPILVVFSVIVGLVGVPDDVIYIVCWFVRGSFMVEKERRVRAKG